MNLTQAGGKLDIEIQYVLLNRCKMTDINLYMVKLRHLQDSHT